MGFQRTGLHDFMYMKTEEQNWKENHGIQNTGTKDSKGKLIVDKWQVLIIWETHYRTILLT